MAFGMQTAYLLFTFSMLACELLLKTQLITPFSWFAGPLLKLWSQYLQLTLALLACQSRCAVQLSMASVTPLLGLYCP